MSARLEAAGGGMTVSGDMTMDHAAILLAQGVTALEQGKTAFDLSAVGEIDSSGLAVLFGWQRTAHQLGKHITIVNPPHNLRSLADVYGVTGLLPLS